MNKPDLKPYLGQQVSVIIDRPLGSVHPRYPASQPYPVNYGYVPDTISGDGQPIDAYLLGILEPVEYARGKVIAVVLRADDNEDKLVIAPDYAATFTPATIWEQISFQEQYFNSTLLTANSNHSIEQYTL